LEFIDRYSYKFAKSNFTEICPVEADAGTCGQPDITKLIGAFYDYGKVLKKGHLPIG
jgi:hypothetical protein